MLDTVQDVVEKLYSPEFSPLPTPAYRYGKDSARLALAVASMKDHMTNEGWEIMRGLGEAGYRLCGYGLPFGETNVAELLTAFDPSVVLLQDKREWNNGTADFRDPHAKFTQVESLRDRSDVFKLTILKDCQQRPGYHMQSAKEIDCHAWVVYYNEKIVARLAPYVRQQHLVRTYHTVDPAVIPAYTPDNRNGCLLSGAVSDAYPLRTSLAEHVKELPETTLLRHPGYHRRGSATPGFMRTLSRYKVAICTASLYGYALRKLIEATACGCMVITNLPTDEVLPEIDGNLVRVPSGTTVLQMRTIIRRCLDCYDPVKQSSFARAAIARYDYRAETARLAGEIERLRADYT